MKRASPATSNSTSAEARRERRPACQQGGMLVFCSSIKRVKALAEALSELQTSLDVDTEGLTVDQLLTGGRGLDYDEGKGKGKKKKQQLTRDQKRRLKEKQRKKGE